MPRHWIELISLAQPIFLIPQLYQIFIKTESLSHTLMALVRISAYLFYTFSHNQDMNCWKTEDTDFAWSGIIRKLEFLDHWVFGDKIWIIWKIIVIINIHTYFLIRIGWEEIRIWKVLDTDLHWFLQLCRSFDHHSNFTNL